jgi:hypothetical protein
METVISVKRDGSGRIEQTVLMQSDILMMMKSMSEETDASEFELLNEDELKANAENMGSGVRFVSAEPMTTESFEGYKAVYSFDDINTLRINQNPGEIVPAPEEDGEEESVKEIITFTFTEGRPSVVTIQFPLNEEAAYEQEEEEQQGPGPDEGQMELIKQLYQNMRLSMKMRFEGTIEETNAAYRDGSELTLFELEFGKIFSNKKAIDTLINSKPETIQEMKSMVEETSGITAEMSETVTVKYF